MVVVQGAALMRRDNAVLVSCEVPTKFLPKFDKYLDYHFVLTHLVLQDDEYRNFYQKSQKYKILDNSAFELGVPVSNSKIVEAAKIICPDEIICRDSMGNGAMTIQRTTESIEYFAKHYSSKTSKVPKMAAVIQGANFKDWLKCLNWVYNNPQIDVISLCGWPSAINAFKDRIKTDDATACRIAALQFMKKEGYVDTPVHLLGMGNNPIELKKVSKFTFVRSCDTSSPIVHGIYAIKFDPKYGLFGPKIREKLNFNLGQLNAVQVASIEHNLNLLKSWGNK